MSTRSNPEPDPATEGVIARADSGKDAGFALTLVQRLLDIGIDGRGPLKSAQHVADKALRKHDGNVSAAISDVVREHLALAGVGGFVTSVGGFVTLPVALPANILEFYIAATRMTAAVAALRGYDLARDNIRTAVMLTLVGADANDLLAKAGLPTATGQLTTFAAERLPGPALMVLNKAIGFRLISRVGRSTFARFGRAVPVVGGAVGAGLDVYLLNRIADGAKREFPPTAPAVGS